MNSERYKPPEWLRQQWEEDARGWVDLENAVGQARRQRAAKEKSPNENDHNKPPGEAMYRPDDEGQ